MLVGHICKSLLRRLGFLFFCLNFSKIIKKHTTTKCWKPFLCIAIGNNVVKLCVMKGLTFPIFIYFILFNLYALTLFYLGEMFNNKFFNSKKQAHTECRCTCIWLAGATINNYLLAFTIENVNRCQWDIQGCFRGRSNRLQMTVEKNNTLPIWDQ